MMVRLIAQQLMQPLTHSYLPNLAKNIWPALQDPFYDREARYTVPYVVWLDGIGWRNDKIGNDIAGMKVPWDIFWESKAWKGKVGILDDERDALAMPMQRDAMRVGRHRPISTPRTPRSSPRPARDLSELTSISNVKVDDHRLPDAARGQVVAAPVVVGRHARRCPLLPAQGHQARGDLVLGARQGRRRAERPALGRRPSAKKPVLAHAFLNFMLDEKNAYDNFVQFNGYTPPQNTIDARKLVKTGLIPKSLAAAVLRPDQFANNQELLALSVEGATLWQDAWSKFKAG